MMMQLHELKLQLLEVQQRLEQAECEIKLLKHSLLAEDLARYWDGAIG
jgi:hypothetical protein